MPLIRGHHAFDDHFTQIPNKWLRDNRISLEARGMLSQILSHRPGWHLSIKSLASQNNIGRDKVKRMIDELLSCGYLERSKKQAHDDNGHLSGYSYTTKDPDGGVTQEPFKAEPYKVPGPPKKNISKNTITKKKRRELRTLPDDWEPNEELHSDEKYSVLNIDREAERFRNHVLSRDIRYKDWDAAFRNWLIRGLDFYQQKHYKESERDRARRELDEWLKGVDGDSDGDG